METKFAEILHGYKGKKGILIPVLQDFQDLEGFISKKAIRYIAENTKFKKAQIYGVATFYSMFRLTPQGENVIRICVGTACHVNNASSIITTVQSELNLNDSKDTTDDAKFTLMKVACLGCCSLSPAMMINDKTYGKLTPGKLRKILKEY